MHLAVAPSAEPKLSARLALRMGFVALGQIARTMGIPVNEDPDPDGPISVSYEQFADALEQIRAVGYPIERSDEQAWQHFRGWRVNYDSIVLALARAVDAPPALWSGDRRWPSEPIKPLRPAKPAAEGRPAARVSAAIETRRVAWWAVPSSALAPVVLIGGWTVAASRQPVAYSSVRDTISALAARGAVDRWIMTGALVVLGLCHVVTASGLRPARTGGRVLLGLGGLATLGVAAFPLPVHGTSAAHAAFAFTAFGCLSVWPLPAAAPGAGPALTTTAARAASAVLVALLVVFGLSLNSRVEGLTERLAAGAQAIWPAVVVLAARFGRPH